jgi:SAM-dependent methyltransferase
VVHDWVVLARQLRALRVPLEGAVLVEVGTGPLPVLPLCFALVGVRACHTFDVARHLDARLTRRALARLHTHLARIAEEADVDADRVRQRYAVLAPLDDVPAMLARAGLRYHAPADAARTPLASRSADVVFSNRVLEHVPRVAIADILRESARILKPDGVSLHSVNCSDHYARFDRSITPINYLRYSDAEWARWNNRILYQNRLRPNDFLQIAHGAGLRIVFSRFTPKRRLLDLLPTLEIAEQFRAYPPAQLCATSLDFAARPR